MPDREISRYRIVSSVVQTEEDLATCRRLAQTIAKKLGLDATTQTRLSTAVSEITRNALMYSDGGTARFELDTMSDPQELAVFVQDEGVAESTSSPDDAKAGRRARMGGLGLGLSGSRRLVSRLDIDKLPDGGTLVKLYLTLPRSIGRKSLSDASEIREALLKSGELDPISELKRQNAELLASLELIERQKEKLARINEDLRRSEERQRNTATTLHTILENLPDAIVLYGADGKFEYSNGPARTLAEISGERHAPFGLEEKLEEAIRTRKDYFPEGRNAVLQEKVNGEDRYFLPRIVSLIGKDESLGGALLLLRDVSNLRLVDDLKSDLVGTVSHEIKGPVTSIRMAVLLLLDNSFGDLNEGQTELAETAKSEIERLLRMLNNLLDVQRYSEGDFSLRRTHCTPAELVRTSLSENDRDASRGEVALLSDLREGSEEIELFVDRERIVYALNNLVSNAINHSDRGEEVRVTVQRVDGDWVEFSVADDGPGIARAHHQLIFNRYAKAPGNRKGGVGLGLALAKEFVQLHGGSISLKSELGAGSCFSFRLPIREEEEPLEDEE